MPAQELRFSNLPPEIKEHIYSHCDVGDLQAVACCSRKCYDSVQYLLWSCVEIPWRTFTFKTLPWKKARKKSLHTKRLSNLHFTRSLRFREDWCGNKTPQGSKRWNSLSQHFKRVLEQCDPSRLVRISLDRVVADEGLVWMCSMLSGVEEMHLNCCYHITDDGWAQLQHLKRLRKLSIRNCEVRDTSIHQLLLVEQLKELRLEQCLQVTCKGLNLITSLVGIEKLTFSYNWHIEPQVYRNFTKLHKLIDLDVRYTNVDDEMLKCLVSLVTGLRTLTLRGCHNISDVGLNYLTVLTCLQDLDVSECSKVTVFGLSQLSALVKLRRLVINRPRTLLRIMLPVE